LPLPRIEISQQPELSPSQVCLLRALRDLRECCIQRLVAAGIDARESERVLLNAIDTLAGHEPREQTDFNRRFIRAVEHACMTFADVRGLPFRRVLEPLRRNWQHILRCAERHGLVKEEALAIIRETIWRHSALWAKTPNLPSRLVAELEASFALVAFGRRERLAPAPRSPALVQLKELTSR
jgi:hypothetical protein